MRQGQDKIISKVIAIKAYVSVTFWIIVKSMFVFWGHDYLSFPFIKDKVLSYFNKGKLVKG